MKGVLTFEPILIEFSLAEREAWYSGEREDCADDYCRNLPVPGTRGFGEYLAGRYWEQRGYDWIHHDYNVFGGNKPDKYGPANEVLRNALGDDRLEAFRMMYRSLKQLRGDGLDLVEEPDLLVYKRSTKEIRFAECKRTDTNDRLGARQALGLLLLETVLQCPVDVFVIAEAGKCEKPTTIEFRYPEDF